MSANLYPKLCQLLEAAGCTFVRQAKGSHEIWYSPIFKRNFTVSRNTVMVYTANKVLKDAGLTKKF